MKKEERRKLYEELFVRLAQRSSDVRWALQILANR